MRVGCLLKNIVHTAMFVWVQASKLVRFTQYYHCEQIKENEMGGVCNIHGGDEKYVQNFGRKT